MQLKQRFVANHPRSVVWDFFGRMDDVVPCMPGASLTEPAAGNLAKIQFNVKLGPISVVFVGDAELERDAKNFRGVIRGNARDNRGDSRVKGIVDYVLTEEDSGARTAVDIGVDFTLTGRLAQFSRAGIVNDLAARLTAAFAQNLEVALAPATAVASNPPPTAAASSPPPTAGASTAPLATPATPRAAPSEINAGRLVFSVLWSRIRAFFRSLIGR